MIIMITGYSAFNTKLSIKTKGNLKEQKLLTTYIENLYKNGDTTLINDETKDQNIRYSGKNPNNYICLKHEKPCQDNNLYRIIGVFNNIKLSENGENETRVKIIKANISTDQKAWDEDNIANWARPSTLNTYLNTNYLVNNNLIDNAVWYLGYAYIYATASEVYFNEKTNNTHNSYPFLYINKIAIMYQSDYGFASKDCYKDKKFWSSNALNDDNYGNDSCKSSNWLYDGKEEWLLDTSYRQNEDTINFISSYGLIIDSGLGHAFPNIKHYYRPVAFLKSNIYLLNNNNTGSIDKPYYITEKY